MGICYIVGAGEFYHPFTPGAGDLVIAADGGYDHLKNFGIRCDLLIGDLDSIKEAPSDVELITHPKRKDETDTYLAYREGVKKGYTTFYIYGGTGGREDHTFANYCLLLGAKNENNSVFLFSEKAKVSLIKNESVTLYSSPGKTLSIFPFGSDASGVSILGAEYECESIPLKADFPLAVSNAFKDGPVTVRVENGALLIMQEI